MPAKYLKICLVHSMPIGSHMFDFLMNKSIAEGRYSYNRHYGEYWASECEYVKRFLRKMMITYMLDRLMISLRNPKFHGVSKGSL